MQVDCLGLNSFYEGLAATYGEPCGKYLRSLFQHQGNPHPEASLRTVGNAISGDWQAHPAGDLRPRGQWQPSYIRPRCPCLVSEPESWKGKVRSRGAMEAAPGENFTSNSSVPVGVPGQSEITPSDACDTRTGIAGTEESTRNWSIHKHEHRFREEPIHLKLANMDDTTSNESGTNAAATQNRWETVCISGILDSFQSIRFLFLEKGKYGDKLALYAHSSVQRKASKLTMIIGKLIIKP